MGTHLIGENDTKLAVQKAKPKLAVPRLYKVILLNDDYTPMEFVVDVLRAFFFMDEATATRTMLEVHYKGQAVCGVYSKDVAETKAALVNDYARGQDHPLLCNLEPE